MFPAAKTAAGLHRQRFLCVRPLCVLHDTRSL